VFSQHLLQIRLHLTSACQQLLWHISSERLYRLCWFVISLRTFCLVDLDNTSVQKIRLWNHVFCIRFHPADFQMHQQELFLQSLCVGIIWTLHLFIVHNFTHTITALFTILQCTCKVQNNDACHKLHLRFLEPRTICVYCDNATLFF